jgi:hypothetical protein
MKATAATVIHKCVVFNISEQVLRFNVVKIDNTSRVAPYGIDAGIIACSHTNAFLSGGTKAGQKQHAKPWGFIKRAVSKVLDCGYGVCRDALWR